MIMMIQPLFIGTTELLLIGGVALLLFGGKKLPEMMRGLGQGVKEFKKGMNEAKEENTEETPPTDPQQPGNPPSADTAHTETSTPQDEPQR